MNTQNILKGFAVLSAVAGLTASAQATEITGTVGGSPVDVSYTIIASANTITVTLNNLEADPSSVIQLISGFSFNVSHGSTSGATTVNTGSIIDVAGNGSFGTPTSDPLLGWGITQSGLNVHLSSLPQYLIIGAPDTGTGLYDDANGSIAANPGHNPFTYKTATFTITDTGVNADTTFSDITFYFGTTPSTLDNPNTPPVPDGGSTVVLLGLAGLGLFAFVRKARTA